MTKQSNTNERYYPLPEPYTGIQMPSVTTIGACAMKVALLYFYGKHGITKAKEISKAATTIGTALHEYAHDFYLGKTSKIKVDQKFQHVIDNFKIFNKTFMPSPVLLEQFVFYIEDKKMNTASIKGYAGTFDGLFLICGKLVLLDYKTSGAIYPDYKLQLEAYYRALKWMQDNNHIDLGEHIKLLGEMELWVVRFDKEESMDVKKDILKFSPSLDRFQGFLGLMEYFYWSKSDDRLTTN